MGRTRYAFFLLAAPAACSSFAPDVGAIRNRTAGLDGSGPPGADGGAADGALPGEAGSSETGSCPIDPTMLLAPCLNVTDYQTGATVIDFGGQLGHVYSPSCVKIPPGTALTWMGDFGTHPLTPSTRGTQPNPIPATSSGATPLSVTFPGVGLYPFYCAQHGDNAGGGMSGVVWACP